MIHILSIYSNPTRWPAKATDLLFDPGLRTEAQQPQRRVKNNTRRQRKRPAREFFVCQPRNWDEPLSDFAHHIAGQIDPFHQVEAGPTVLGNSDPQNHMDGVENGLAEAECHDSDADCSDSGEDLDRLALNHGAVMRSCGARGTG